MSRFLLVRHGQATIGGDDYDQLSDRGRLQARIVGEHWARLGLVLDRVYVGPLRRHRQTAEEAQHAFVEAGGTWPNETSMEELREHAGPEVVVRAMEELPEHDAHLGDLMKAMTGDAHRDISAYFRIFRYVMRQWIRDELELASDGLEPWQVFRGRIEAGLERLAVDTNRGHTAAVFTSGGPIGVAAASVLGLGDEKALELTWTVRNATVTELAGRRRGLSLTSFNSASHLPSADLVTLV